ncbi:MAG: G8 domain-containing protein [Anaerolineales bacterium]|nr:G8 domain-containing protein [Anaerolineales bacterium]
MNAIYALPCPSAPCADILAHPKPGTSPLVMKRGRAIAAWSDPATWGDRLPRAGDSVVIPPGGRVLMDVSPPPLKGLQIDGLLWFDDGEVSLTAQWIMVRGEFRIGAPERPAVGRAEITLASLSRPGRHTGGTGTRFLTALDGGRVLFCGEWRQSRAKLAASAEAGARDILVDQVLEWRPGDRVVVGLSGSPAHLAEERGLESVEGNVLRLDEPLAHAHWGGLQTYRGATTDWRTEVGLLTRNVVIRGEAAAGGGYLMVMPRGRLHLESVELTGLGHQEHLPVHLDPAVGPEAFAMTGSSLHHNRRPVSMLFQGDWHGLRHNVVYDPAPPG